MRCVECESHAANARGLCNRCYYLKKRTGELHLFPRAKRPNREVVEDYMHLSKSGCGMAEISARMGIQEESIRTALRRSRRGD